MAKPAQESQGNARYHVRAILRALDVLEAFTSERPTLSLAEASEAVALNAGTTFRVLATLRSRRYVEHDGATGRYRLGVACLNPSSTFLAQLSIRERVYPFLERLRDETRETVHLSILDPHTMEVIYLEKLEGLEPIGPMRSRVGGRAPAHCTGVGKILLAYSDREAVDAFFAKSAIVRHTPNTVASLEALVQELDRARQRGYAIDNAEHEDGVMCVAVPIWDHLNRVQAAVSVSGTVERISQAVRQGDLVQKVLEVSIGASEQLGYVRRAPGGGALGTR